MLCNPSSEHSGDGKAASRCSFSEDLGDYSNVEEADLLIIDETPLPTLDLEDTPSNKTRKTANNAQKQAYYLNKTVSVLTSRNIYSQY